MTGRARVAAGLVVAMWGGCAGGGEQIGTAGGEVAVTWTNAVGVSAAGDDLEKTDLSSAWNAGAVSVTTLAGDGYVEFTTAEATTAKMVGLSAGDSGQAFADIDFAIHLKASGRVGVYEGGILRGGNFTSYAAGDLFRVEAKAGVVTYARNGAVFYTSGVAPDAALGVDTSLYTPGATIRDVRLVSTTIHWQNLVGVAASGDDLSKTGGQALWNAGASSVEALEGDGFVELTAPDNTTARMAGLGSGDDSQHYADIEHAIYLRASGTVAVYESGVAVVGNAGSYLPGDTFRVEVSQGIVRYSMNGGVPFHTSSVAPTFPLRVDTSLHTPGATLGDVKLVEAADACPAYRSGGLVCEGNFTIRNEADRAAIADCAEIIGTVYIQAPGMTVIALPRLERVTHLWMSGNSDLVRLRLPALVQVDGVLSSGLQPVTSGADLSRLKSASVDSSFVAKPLALPCLESAGSFWAYDFHVPRLRTVSQGIAGRLYAPALERAGGVTADLVAPVLRTITGNASGQVLDAPILTDVGGQLTYRNDTRTPALARAGEIFIAPSTTSLDLPALVEVAGTIWSSFPEIPVVDLPALRRAGALHLGWTALEEVHVPQLETLTGPTIAGNPGLAIGATQPVELPALTSVRGAVSMNVAASLPALTSIRGKLFLNPYPFSAPQLAEVRGPIVVDPDTTAVSLPALASAYSLVFGPVESAIETVELPALTTLAGGGAGAGKLILANPRALSALSLPSLQSTAGAFIIRGDGASSALASLDLPNLVSVGPSLSITDLPLLATCAAQDVVDQLARAGWTGEVDISGNDDGGTCP